MVVGQTALMAATDFATLCEFVVQASSQAEFERHYSPDGSWARLFRQSPGYRGSELLNDRANPLRYVTIDRWVSVDAFREFHARFAEQYESLDRQCERFTTHEAALGEYAYAPAGARPAH